MLSMNSPDNPDATQPSLRVLLVDDSLEDALLVVQELAHSRFQLSWERVDNESAYLRNCRQFPILSSPIATCLNSVRCRPCNCSSALA